MSDFTLSLTVPEVLDHVAAGLRSSGSCTFVVQPPGDALLSVEEAVDGLRERLAPMTLVAHCNERRTILHLTVPAEDAEQRYGSNDARNMLTGLRNFAKAPDHRRL